MTVYKALYKKIMDDLKDSQMWLDWSYKVDGEYSKYLYESAKKRIMQDLPESMKWFKKACDECKQEELCDTVMGHIEDWHESLKSELERGH